MKMVSWQSCVELFQYAVTRTNCN